MATNVLVADPGGMTPLAPFDKHAESQHHLVDGDGASGDGVSDDGVSGDGVSDDGATDSGGPATIEANHRDKRQAY
jgi:hypothetical protein